jgi:hypothetical protein
VFIGVKYISGGVNKSALSECLLWVAIADCRVEAQLMAALGRGMAGCGGMVLLNSGAAGYVFGYTHSALRRLYAGLLPSSTKCLASQGHKIASVNTSITPYGGTLRVDVPLKRHLYLRV